MYKPNLAIEAQWVPENLLAAADQVESRVGAARCGCPLRVSDEVRTLEVCLEFNQRNLQAAGLTFGRGMDVLRRMLVENKHDNGPLHKNATLARVPAMLRAAADRVRWMIPHE